MALLFIDGFDHYASANINTKWTYTTGETINATGGRRSGGCYTGSYGHGSYKTLSSASSSIIVGFAINISVLDGGYPAILTLREGSTLHLTLKVDSYGNLILMRGGALSTGTLLATSNAVLTPGIWYYIEIKATISDSTGATEVRINGVADSGLTLSSADTRNGGTSGVISAIEIGQQTNSNGLPASFDDLYVCDTSGSVNNNFLGDCRVDTIYPTGAGNYTQFTPSTGSNYACVDEPVPNTTDYVSSATSGNRDSYAFGDLAALSSQTVYGLQVNAYAQKSDAGARSLGTMARLSSTDKDVGSVALGTSYSYVSQIFETDPASAAWTESKVNSAEFGVKVTA